MSIFEKIKKTLETEDACVISKGSTPLYVTLTWDAYQRLHGRLEEVEKEKEQQRDGEYDIDINTIPI